MSVFMQNPEMDSEEEFDSEYYRVIWTSDESNRAARKGTTSYAETETKQIEST